MWVARIQDIGSSKYVSVGLIKLMLIYLIRLLWQRYGFYSKKSGSEAVRITTERCNPITETFVVCFTWPLNSWPFWPLQPNLQASPEWDLQSVKLSICLAFTSLGCCVFLIWKEKGTSLSGLFKHEIPTAPPTGDALTSTVQWSLASCISGRVEGKICSHWCIEFEHWKTDKLYISDMSKCISLVTMVTRVSLHVLLSFEES